jgi:acetyl-CoA carboxylase beta subunit
MSFDFLRKRKKKYQKSSKEKKWKWNQWMKKKHCSKLIY